MNNVRMPALQAMQCMFNNAEDNNTIGTIKRIPTFCARIYKSVAEKMRTQYKDNSKQTGVPSDILNQVVNSYTEQSFR